MNRSWKTTLGGSLAALGAFLWGAPVALKAFDPELVSPGLGKWCIIFGLIANAGGVFFMGLFGRDNNVSSEDVQAAKLAKELEREEKPGRLSSWFVCLFPFLLVGVTMTAAVGCRSLAPGGVYDGDKLLFESETTIVTSYDLVDTFLKWEQDNEQLLSKWPGIHKGAVKMRQDFPHWYNSANALHDAYEQTRDVETGKQLATTLALLRAALNEAAGYMVTAAR